MIQQADRAMAMDFLDHLCETWKINSEGTSWEYWRQYKQLYSSVTGKYVDRNDGREVLKVSQRILRLLVLQPLTRSPVARCLSRSEV